ncbi:sugar O-acetyltransferase [Actinomadura rayongensis]
MGGHKERMLAGEPFTTDDPELAADALRAARLCERFNGWPAADPPGRRAILADLLGSLGEGAYVAPPLRVDYGYRVTLGHGAFVNFGAVLLDAAGITIGADVQIGPYVQLLTPSHPVESGPRRNKWQTARPIEIGDNAWLGGGVIVCPGVTIGPDAVVGAGSVVTRDVPRAVVVAGNPARVVREL